MSSAAGTPILKDVLNALPVDLDFVTGELELKARVELSEDEEKVTKGLKSLRSMLKGEADLRWQDDDLFLLAFLRVKKFDVGRAFGLVKGLYTTFGRYGRLFYGLSFDGLSRAMEANTLTFLPYRDSEGSVVMVAQFKDWDPETVPADQVLTCVTFGLIQALRSPSTQIAGFHIVVDFKDYGLKQFLSVKPSVLKLFAEIVQNSAPIRLRGIHAVNENRFFSYVWALMKRVLSKKLQNRVHFHGSDMSSLHKFFQPSILPANLGGELPTFDNSDWRERMVASAHYIEHVRSFGYEKYLRDWEK